MFGVLKEQGGQCGRGVKGENNGSWTGNGGGVDGGGHGRNFRESGFYSE